MAQMQTAAATQTAPTYTWADKDNWHDMPRDRPFWMVHDEYGEVEVHEVEYDHDATFFYGRNKVDYFGTTNDDGEPAKFMTEADAIGWALDRKTAVRIAAFAEAVSQ
jgi:hypothetical protein